MKKAKRKERITSFSAVLFILVSTVFTAVGQIFLKSGVGDITSISSVLNYQLLMGLLLYGFALLLVVKAFKHGELSVLYPILALSYIWVVLLSNFILNEPLTQMKLLGVAAIFIGVTLIGIGGE
ncbi:MAG TPA: EamA family transporter [Nanoarchaeota archaeon]|nr:MAG: membrane protein [archaeon GW2011_AR6]MBS3083135.1 EamA family transporter [Candidatus Pacearchaeota archaeon]HIH17774.1 EamA family transporter [Nanoarchaeota archaeon]HIH34028.1 EamA family transporter [Nanoarchaeota archaeon]HIH51642.1 EamA family transporter [Nanoarchaeota archaeon]